MRLSESALKQNQKHPGSVQKSASLWGEDIIRDQRALRKLQRSLTVQAPERPEQFSLSV